MRNRLPPVLQQRDYALLWVALLVMAFATQMTAVAVGWQVYAIHENPFDLGLIGLAEFLPLPLLALPAGQIADRFSRRRVFAVSLVVEIAVACLLLVVTVAGASQLWPFLALAAATGVAGALGAPAGRSIPPEVVSTDLLPSAMAFRSMAGQAAVIGGPAIGGVLFAVDPELVYALAIGLLSFGLGCILALGARRLAATPSVGDRVPGFEGLMAGIGFIRRTPVLLGAISLDLFAVLFGGAVALLPVFARSILHTGPEGLGILRSAPAVGALIAGVMLTRRPLGRNAGRTLLFVVGPVRGEHGRLRALPLVRALARRAGRERLRGHDQHEHPLDHRGARDARSVARPREFRRERVHLRLERARRLRVGARGRTDRCRAGGRRRRRGHDRRRRGLATPFPGTRTRRPAGRRPAGVRTRLIG